MVQRTRPGISRFRVRAFSAPRNDGASLARPRYPSTGRLAWLACGTARFRDIWECVQSQPSAFPENTMVARPGRGNGFAIEANSREALRSGFTGVKAPAKHF